MKQLPIASIVEDNTNNKILLRTTIKDQAKQEKHLLAFLWGDDNAPHRITNLPLSG